MTITDQIKIMQSEVQHDLNRKVATIYGFSSNNMDKYEYLTGEDLGLKPSTIEQAKFEQLQAIKDQREKKLKELKNIDKSKTLKAIDEISKKNNEANKLLPKFKKTDRIFDKAELVFTKTDGTKYDFNRFALTLKFIEKIHNYEITLDEEIDEQTELRKLINKLNDYGPRISKKNRREK